MALWSRVREAVTRERQSRKVTENDAPADTASGRTRATGGVPDADAGDQNSTTGTTPSDTFVGRASGDEAGDSGISGAEARAAGDQGTPDDRASGG